MGHMSMLSLSSSPLGSELRVSKVSHRQRATKSGSQQADASVSSRSCVVPRACRLALSQQLVSALAALFNSAGTNQLTCTSSDPAKACENMPHKHLDVATMSIKQKEDRIFSLNSCNYDNYASILRSSP